jgi:hypothetical protein
MPWRDLRHMKKPISKAVSKEYLNAASKIQSWNPIERNGWLVKFSIFNNDHILIFFVSTYTGQTIIRQFESEIEAINFINHVVELNPQYAQHI